jgi:flagellar motility protein MotE (MotC chaperone)
MMCRVEMNSLMRLLRILAPLLAAGLLMAGSAKVSQVAAQTQWQPSIESQAERAYREVYSRSQARRKAASKRAARKVKAEKVIEVPLPAAVPEFPERNWEKSVEEIVASVDPEETTQAVPKDDAPAPPAEAIAAPAQPLPTELGQALTTQVIGDGQGAPPADAQQTPKTTGDQFCSNVTDAARDARFVWQKQTLQEAEKQVEVRVQELNAKIAEYQTWVTRREEFSRKAQATITDIYAKMKPDAAAQQLTALDEETAAAVITKLNPRVSSALMAEMDPKQAARLTAIISASSKGPKGKPPAAPQSGGT